jgi:hypothetical protein
MLREHDCERASAPMPCLQHVPSKRHTSEAALGFLSNIFFFLAAQRGPSSHGFYASRKLGL